MEYNKYVDYYYKQCELDATDDLERIMFEAINEYGYNFSSSSRKVVNYERLCNKPRFRTNNSLNIPKK